MKKDLTDRKIWSKIISKEVVVMERKEKVLAPAGRVSRQSPKGSGAIKKEGVREEVVAGLIYLLCAGLSLLPVGIMKVFNMWHSGVAFLSYFLAAVSLIFLLLEFISFFLGEDEEE